MILLPKLMKTYLKIKRSALRIFLSKKVDKINELSDDYRSLSDSDLLDYFEKSKDMAKSAANPERIEVHLIAVIREVAHRTLSMYPHNVQLLAALLLRRRKIIQMNVGEGKTLVAPFVAIMEKLYGRQVIIVTSNDYLSDRDAHWMGPLYQALGVSVSSVQPWYDAEEKLRAYRADVIYVSTQQIVFDYLGKNHSLPTSDFQIPHETLIVDEIDNVLLDQGLQPYALVKSNNSQRIEEKEALPLSQPNTTIKQITLQGFFSRFSRISGMSSSAIHNDIEFKMIFNLDVVPIPPNAPCIRRDYEDAIFRTKGEQISAVVNEVEDCVGLGRPVLIGTTNIEDAESVAEICESRGLDCRLLTAKNHFEEAQIIEQAGRSGRITIAAPMAGRGVSIILDHEALQAGGLHVIGVGRNWARRLDEQLQGQSGIQGNPGSSRFIISLEDDLMNLAVPERILNIMATLSTKGGELIGHPRVTRAVEMIQKRLTFDRFYRYQTSKLFEEYLGRIRETLFYRSEEHKKQISVADTDIREAMAALISTRVEEAHEVNWDGEGGLPALPGSAETALRFLEIYSDKLPMADVGIDPDGEVSFEWYTGPDRLLAASFSEVGKVTYAGRGPYGGMKGTFLVDPIGAVAIRDALELIGIVTQP